MGLRPNSFPWETPLKNPRVFTPYRENGAVLKPLSLEL